jgi:hypothetical protein
MIDNNGPWNGWILMDKCLDATCRSRHYSARGRQGIVTVRSERMHAGEVRNR